MTAKTIKDVCKEGLTFPIEMDSLSCNLHKETHENCVGCASHKSCKEYVTRYGQYVTTVLKEEGFLSPDYTWEAGTSEEAP